MLAPERDSQLRKLSDAELNSSAILEDNLGFIFKVLFFEELIHTRLR